MVKSSIGTSFTSTFTVRVLLLAWLALMIDLVEAQNIGPTICGCFPSVYTFQLRFDQSCSLSTLSNRPGLAQATAVCSNLKDLPNQDFEPDV